MTETEHPASVARAFGGWALARSCALEAFCPGVVARILQMQGSFTRQCVFAALAVHKEDTPELADAIIAVRPKQLLEFAFGHPIPAGYAGTLRRLGHLPLRNRCSYVDLFNMFARGDVRARALMQVSGSIGHGMIEMAICLDPAIASPSIFSRLRGTADVARLEACISVIRATCSGITDAEIRSSLKSSSGELDVGEWARRVLLRKMDQAPVAGPIMPEDDEFTPLITGADFAIAARSFRNCLRMKVPYASCGRAAFAVARSRKLVLEFRRVSCAPWWLMVGAYGPRNQALSFDDHQWLLAELYRRSIPMIAAAGQQAEMAFESMRAFDMGLFDPPINHAA